ncbi:MAG: nuclear transport factor 2 family protein [Planctomycetota bacterium]
MLRTATLPALAALAAMNAPLAQDLRTERIVFEIDGTELVGTLYLPAGVDPDHPAPGVVVTGAWTTIKEQMAGRYAREAALRGRVALAFDFRGWGESGGTPRSLESPDRKIEDVVAAAAYLRGRPEVSSVGALGVCASAGYVVHAATRSEAIESVALVAPWLHDAAIVEEVYGGPESVAALVAAGRAAERRAAETGQPTRIPAAGPEGSDALMPGASYYVDPERGALARWENTFDVSSWEGWLTFDALEVAPRLRQPLLVVHSDAAAIPGGARAFFGAATTDRRQLWLEEVSQFDFYDAAEPVEAASDAAAKHFAATLRSDRREEAAGNRETVDTARVLAVCASITAAVDGGRFDVAEAAFSDEVRVDYTSLWGGAPQETSRADLIAGWRGLVPGFDATWHEVTGFAATVDGDRAVATAAVDARHWLDGELWRPIGTYRWELARGADGWRVASMKLELEREVGPRSLVARATERAASGAGR